MLSCIIISFFFDKRPEEVEEKSWALIPYLAVLLIDLVGFRVQSIYFAIAGELSTVHACWSMQVE